MEKKCIIIHGCPSTSEDQTYDKHWIPWIKQQLIANNIDTETPKMPSPWQPDYVKFKAEFEKLGYVVKFKVIKCDNHGVPQSRERLFIVDIKKFFF